MKEKMFRSRNITESKITYDEDSKEVLREEKEHKTEFKRKKGTFCITYPEELVFLCGQSKVRAINKMLSYIILNCNYKNEFTFEKSFIATYPKINKFYEDRKFLLNNELIFREEEKKNVFTLSIKLVQRCDIATASKIYEKQFGEKMKEDNTLYYTIKNLQKLNNTELEMVFKAVQEKLEPDKKTNNKKQEQEEEQEEEQIEETELEKLERQAKENVTKLNLANMEVNKLKADKRNIARRIKELKEDNKST